MKKIINKKTISLLIAATSLSATAWANSFTVYQKQLGSTYVPFVKNANKEEKSYSDKVDFAFLESLAPLKPEVLANLKPNHIRELSLEEFNQMFARLNAGPMPKGEYAGFVVQKPPVFHALKKRLMKNVMASEDLAKLVSTLCKREAEDCAIELLWSGKRFDEKNEFDQIRAATVINPVSAGLKVTADNNSWFKTGLLGKIFGATQKLGSQLTPSLFPMNTYCGISLVDTRRESIITDGAFADDFGFPDYVSLRDQIITRKGLKITEEFRLVRPGLYAGRVYLDKIFLFSVVLEQIGNTVNPELTGPCEDTIKML